MQLVTYLAIFTGKTAVICSQIRSKSVRPTMQCYALFLDRLCTVIGHLYWINYCTAEAENARRCGAFAQLAFALAFAYSPWV